jgi:hypothetical protein
MVTTLQRLVDQERIARVMLFEDNLHLRVAIRTQRVKEHRVVYEATFGANYQQAYSEATAELPSGASQLEIAQAVVLRAERELDCLADCWKHIPECPEEFVAEAVRELNSYTAMVAATRIRAFWVCQHERNS